MDLEDFFRSLEVHKIRYLLCGGLAVNIYGIPRSTADVDILLDFNQTNVDSFMTAMNLLSFKGTIPLRFEVLVDLKERERLINERNMIAYSFFNSAKNVFVLDVLVKMPSPFDALWNSREERPFGKTVIQLISVDDLIKMKEATDRIQDKNDVILLSRLRNANGN